MILTMFAVRDIATSQFGNPMFLISEGQAIRSFADEVNREEKDNMLNKHPEHFELYKLGEYNTDNGTIEAITPKQVTTATQLLIKKQ